MKIEVVIGHEGGLRAIYHDALAPIVHRLGATVQRASHVEPCVGGWQADLLPVGGPILGPFALRQEALAAEVEWLRANMIRRGAA